MKTISKFIGILFFCLEFLTLKAQYLPPIQLDRPDQTECPFTVPKGYIQLEGGISFDKINKTEKQFVHPTILTKYGVNERFELRLITEYNTQKIANEKFTGLNPVEIGFKTKLLSEKGIFPAVSFIAHLSLPFLASHKFKSTYYAPNFRFTMQHSLSDKVSLGYNLGAEWDGEHAEPTFIYTLTNGFAVSDKLGTYIELYGFIPQKEKKIDHRFDGGFTYLIQPHMMFDFSAGVGLTKDAPDYYIATGFSIRLKN